MTAKHTGTCFCGAVALEVSGAPEAMGYCHCGSCRSWSAGPVNAFTLWKPENVKVTKGARARRPLQEEANSERQWCTKCGGHVLTHHPVFGSPMSMRRRSEPRVQAGAARELRRDGAANERRAAEAQGLPGELGGSGESVPE